MAQVFDRMGRMIIFRAFGTPLNIMLNDIIVDSIEKFQQGTKSKWQTGGHRGDYKCAIIGIHRQYMPVRDYL
jgi:hypothetical protein